jgi:acetyl esterase/lipase
MVAVITGYITYAKATVGYGDLLARQRPVPSKQLHYGPQPDQFGELWLPEGKVAHPVVVMIHGGCWQAALPGVELMAYIAEDLRKSGIAVWNIEYRRLGTDGAGYPGTFLDTANGIDYLRQIADTYKLDISRLVVMGHSAGGHLALWAAARNRIAADSQLYTQHPLPIKLVITLAGINNLAAYRNNGPRACGGPRTIDLLVGAGAREEPYTDTSPVAMLPIGVKQIIVSGDLDSIVPAKFGNAYGAAAQAAGDKVSVMNLKNAGHFELIDPTSDAWGRIKAEIVAALK